MERTPALAIAAGLTDYVWTLEEVLRYPIPPADLVAVPRPRRGRTRGTGDVIPFPRGRTRPPHTPSPRRAAHPLTQESHMTTVRWGHTIQT